MKSNRKRRRASRYLLALLIAPLLCPFSVSIARADDADEAKARTEADAKVQAAQTPIEKINAFYLRARLAGQMESPEVKDWKQAEDDINEAVRLVAEFEAGGKQTVNGKSGIYFEQGYIEDSLKHYEKGIAAYDMAEKAGYAKDNAKEPRKGSELWDNRGLAKSAIYDYAGAIADFKAAIALFDKAQWHQHLARALYNKGDLLLAVPEWGRAVEMDVTIGESDFDAAQAPLNREIFNNPGKAAPLIERARYIFTQMRDGKTKANDDLFNTLYGDAGSKKADALMPALSDLDRAVKAEPNSPAPFIERGRMRLVSMKLRNSIVGRDFEYDDTQKDFDKAIELDPKNAEAWFESGVAHLALWEQGTGGISSLITSEAEKTAARDKAFAGAIRDFSRAIYLKPDTAGEARFQRASVELHRPHPDANALLIDYSAALAQNLAPLDADWHALLHPNPAPKAADLGEAHRTRGKILLSHGQLAAALADFDSAVGLNEGDLNARFERGKLRVQRGDYDGALEDFSRIVKDNPKVGDPWLWRGVAHDGKGETEAAKADIKEAITRDAKLAAMIKGSRYDNVNPNAQRSLVPPPQKEDIRDLPPGTALDHKNAGNALRGKKDMDGALDEFNLALMIDPNFADALNNRAAVYVSRGEVDLALADFNRAIESDPKHRVAYLNRAAVWDTVGESEKQMADLNHAIEFADNDERRATAYGARAAAHEKANHQAESLSDAKKATELAPKSGEAWSVLGKIQFSRGDHADAIKSLRRAIEESAGLLEAHVNLSLALAITNDAAAAEEFEQVIHLAEPNELLPIGNAVEHDLKLYPDSAALKAMRNRVVKAMQDAEPATPGDGDPLFLL